MLVFALRVARLRCCARGRRCHARRRPAQPGDCRLHAISTCRAFGVHDCLV